MDLTIVDDPTLSTIWLMSTLTQNANHKVTKKTIESINIPTACDSIITYVDSLSLRKSSGLLYGTVLVYKKKCENALKDGHSVKYIIGQMKKVMCMHNFINKNDYLNKNKDLVLLRDDPRFDIGRGLGLTEGINDVMNLLKDSGNGKKIEDWKADNGLEEDNEENNESSYRAEKEKNIIDSNIDQMKNWKAGDSQVEMDEIWNQELDFQFDQNGNAVDLMGNSVKIGNNDKPDDKALQTNNILDGLDLIPDFFDPAIQELEIQPEIGIGREYEGEQEKEKNTKTYSVIIKSSKGSKRRKVEYDNNIYLSTSEMKENRDAFVELELAKREKFLNNRLKVSIDVSDFIIDYQSMLASIKCNIYPSPQNSMIKDPSGFEFGNEGGYVDEIEINRKRRSSSVSSIEQGRRAADTSTKRNSDLGNSFHFDLNLDNQPVNHILSDINLDANMAQIDISFPDDAQGVLEDNDEHLAINLTDSLEGFYDNLISEMDLVGIENSCDFSDLFSSRGTLKKQAAIAFHQLLHLATRDKVHLGINKNTIGKSKWDLLDGDSITVTV